MNIQSTKLASSTLGKILLGIGIVWNVIAYPTASLAQRVSPTATLQAQANVNGENAAMSPTENFNNGNFSLAIQQWSQEIFQGLNLVSSLYNRSQAYILIQRPQLALNDLDKLIELQGNRTPAEVFVVRGIALTELNQFDQAIASFNQAEALKPSPLLYSNRALTYQKLGQLDLAITDLEQSVKIAPFPINRVNLANARIQNGEFALVIEDMTQVIAQQNTFFPAYSARGIAYYNLNQYEQAIRDFVTSLSLFGDQPEAYYYAGLSFAKLGRMEDAQQNLAYAANLYLQENQLEFYQQILEDISKLQSQS